MVTTQFLFHGPDEAPATLLLAHGAGAPMDSPSMTSMTKALAGVGFRVVRFEFAYMAARRSGEGRKPPPKAERLVTEYLAAATDLSPTAGKSMGGRVASMVADKLPDGGKVAGLLCLGYPFHPPAKPDQLRTAHLVDLRSPILICQGTRDNFGTRVEVTRYALSNAIDILWLEDGDHDLKRRKSASGLSAADHLRTMAYAVFAWSRRVIDLETGREGRSG